MYSEQAEELERELAEAAKQLAKKAAEASVPQAAEHFARSAAALANAALATSMPSRVRVQTD